MLITLKKFFIRHLTPQRIFVLSFLAIIIIGTFLLWLPFSSSRKPLTFIDALFTSTSAVCVTGLTVIDIGLDLSYFGQIVTLILFQIGGIGIITFSVFFFHLMGISVSFKEREIIQSSLTPSPRHDFQVILKYVLLSTFIIEFFGCLVLSLRFLKDFSIGKAVYYGIYHAVSAFNNCGYALFSNSLMDYRDDMVINIAVMTLIILGGIGFFVHFDMLSYLTSRKKKKRLTLHTKIVLITTIILIFSGALFFYLFERHYNIKDLTLTSQLLVSFFQSVTARTAGFNTIEIGKLTNDTILLLMMLMFIGASPGSTGGGVKTTSLALLVVMIWNRLKGGDEVNVMNRTVPKELISKTVSIIFASAISIVIITSLVLFTCTKSAHFFNRSLFIEYLFDTISAFGTVGLSMGITPQLNSIQKFIISIMMFAGRVGPLTLAFSLTVKTKKVLIKYAEEDIMVG
ncbi:MAG: TrkH family potassium uptake protein [Syntrophorhabdaceae bacterium]|nr:TrkH family potassium uptake protein [Syntrophorhabdaceae bacterium]